jgi:hypothetical protein
LSLSGWRQHHRREQWSPQSLHLFHTNIVRLRHCATNSKLRCRTDCVHVTQTRLRHRYHAFQSRNMSLAPRRAKQINHCMQTIYRKRSKRTTCIG